MTGYQWHAAERSGRGGIACGSKRGTTAGYYRHVTLDEKACAQCLAAKAAYQRARRERRADPDEPVREYGAAWYAAHRRLARRYPEEFRALLLDERARRQHEEASR